MSDLPGYAAAQAEYDNRTPPDDGPSECPYCDGKGYEPAPDDYEGDTVTCSACKGFGLVDESGNPFDPHAAEVAACDRADFERDRRLTDKNDGEDWRDGEYDF